MNTTEMKTALGFPQMTDADLQAMVTARRAQAARVTAPGCVPCFG